jgi:voltage-gated potassium channel
MPFMMLNLFQRMQRRIEMHRGHAIKIFTGWLVLMAVLHVVAMMTIEAMGLSDAIWVTFVTATTVGYGDVSAKTVPGRAATIIIMFFGTIFVLAALASLLFERAAEKRDRKTTGKWRWNLNDHILIISTTGTESVRYLTALVAQLRADPAFAERPVQVMTHGFDADGLPDGLANLKVVYARGDGDSDEEMALCNATAAHMVVVLGDDRTAKADALVYDVVSRVRAAGFQGRIIAECEDDRNRARLSAGPMDSCVRPSRAYPEMLGRAIVAPGAERVIEEIFTFGGIECEFVSLGRSADRGTWRDVVGQTMDAGLGMPIAYRNDNHVVTSPPSGDRIVADGVYVLMGQDGQEACKGRLALLLAA